MSTNKHSNRQTPSHNGLTDEVTCYLGTDAVGWGQQALAAGAAGT